ncbi:hypothetical protein Avbf_16578 [Armadillidium vulgare]|nr:hypothetical protein Avbf_16578 [Armadillidium vulgare]
MNIPLKKSCLIWPKIRFGTNDFVKRKHFGFIPENVISVGMILLMQNFSENFNADFYRNPVTDNEKLMFGVIIGWDKNYNLFNDTAYKEKCYFGGQRIFSDILHRPIKKWYNVLCTRGKFNFL